VQKSVLSPGDSTVVELIFNTRAVRGKVTKSARVSSNDSTRTSVAIDFTTTVMVEPDTASMITFLPNTVVLSESSKKQEVRVQNRSRAQIELAVAGTIPEGIEGKIKDKTVAGGKTGRMTFQWQGESPEYDENKTVTIETGAADASRFSIPLTIKGEKGPKPGSQPQHGAVTNPPTQQTTAGSPPAKQATQSGRSQVPSPTRQNVRPKTMHAANPDSLSNGKEPEGSPIEGAKWPPK